MISLICGIVSIGVTTMSAPSIMSGAPELKTFAMIGINDFSIVSLLCLITLLCASYLLSSTKYWSKRLSAVLNLSIMPMTLTFLLIVGAVLDN